MRRERSAPFTVSSGLPTGFGANFSAAFDAFRREDQSTSEFNAYHRGFQTYIDRFEAATGERLDNPMDMFVPPQPVPVVGRDTTTLRLETIKANQERVAAAREANPGLFPEGLGDFPGMDEILADFAARARGAREAEQDVFDRGGGAGRFSGIMAGAVSDPAVLSTLPIGAAAGTRILGAAAIEGVIGAGTEAVIQPQVFKFKGDIGSPYSVSEALANVLFAGAGGAGAAVVLRGSARAGRSVLNQYRKVFSGRDRRVPQAERTAAQVVEREAEVAEASPFEETLDGDTAHAQAFEEAYEKTTVEAAPTDFEAPPVPPSPRELPALPGGLTRFEPTELQVDAERFQFKGGADEAGVTDRLQGVTEFDERLAGVVLVYEDAAGGKFIVDGHQRLALANRAQASGQEGVGLNGYVLRETDGVTAGEARAVAAFKNIAEGTGTALDAAKVIREVGERGLPALPPRSSLVRHARGLSQLSDDAFYMVVNEVVPANYAAIVGRLIREPELQRAVLDLLAKLEPANEIQAEAMVRQAREAGFDTATQDTLFGTEVVAESLFQERAQVLDTALKMARQDRRTFSTLLREENRIKTAGNALDTQANRARVSETDHVLAAVSRLANRKGAISDALTEAARAFRSGSRRRKGAAEDFLDAIRRAARDGLDLGDDAGAGGRLEQAAEPPSSPLLDGAVEQARGRLAQSEAEVEAAAPALKANADDAAARMGSVAVEDAEGKVIRVSGREVTIPASMLDEMDDAASRPSTSEINTPERQALRDQLVDEYYGGGAPAKNREIHIVMGISASGKSSQVAEPLVKERSALLIDSDEVKKMLPEYDGGKGAAAVHVESSDLILPRIMARAMENGDNIVWPTVGKTRSTLQRQLKDFKSAGYKVHLHYIDLPAADAIERAIGRYFRTGRLVHPEYIASVGDFPLRNFEAVKGDADAWAHYSSVVPKGQPLELVDQSHPAAAVRLAGQRRDAGVAGKPGSGQEVEIPVSTKVNADGQFAAETRTYGELNQEADNLDLLADAIQACNGGV